MIHVVKVQLPLATNMEEPQALVYTEGRAKTWFVPISDELVTLMQGSVREFFHARENGEGKLTILPPALGEQGW